MNETCYHCEHDTTNPRYVTFYEKDYEHNEPLCEECYSEWLQSLKG